MIQEFHQQMKRNSLETAKRKLEEAGDEVQKKVEAELEQQIQSLTAEIENLSIADALNSQEPPELNLAT